jgi:methionyl-tRNA formyltransferase
VEVRDVRRELLFARTFADAPPGAGLLYEDSSGALALAVNRGDAARELGIELDQPQDVNSEGSRARITAAEPDVVCVCAFGALIKEPLLSRYPMLNVHPSLLPRWRGAAPVERALMEGDAETGVTIFRITEGLDSGPIALARSEPIHPDDTAGTLASRLASLGGSLLIEALDRLESGTLEFLDQGEDGASYARKIDPAERRLDHRRSALELERVVRALTPRVGAYVVLPGGEHLGVTSARVTDEALEPGALVAREGRLLLGCSNGALELVEVHPAGKRPMPAEDWLRGHGVPERVETP